MVATSFLSLELQPRGQRNWHTELNENFEKLDDFLASLSVGEGEFFGNTYDLRHFGARVDHADMVEPLRDALAEAGEAGGGVVSIPFPCPVDLSDGPLTLPARVAVDGTAARNQISVLGTDPVSLFVSSDAELCGLSRIKLLGNGQATNATNGGAWEYYNTLSSHTTRRGLFLLDVEADNFGADVWFNFVNFSADANVEEIFIDRLRAISRLGNAREPTNIAVSSMVLAFWGADAASDAAFIKDVVIRDFYADCTHIKGACAIWHNVDGLEMVRPRIISPGLLPDADGNIEDGTVVPTSSTGYNNKGCIGVQIYQQGSGTVPPTNIRVVRPYITDPRSCGIYCASGGKVEIIEPQISGQFDQQYASLPKGAIVTNGTLDLRVRGGDLRDNFHSITGSIIPTSDTKVLVEGTRISSAEDLANAVRFGVLAGTGDARVELRGIEIELTGNLTTEFFLFGDPGANLQRLEISGSKFISGQNAISMDVAAEDHPTLDPGTPFVTVHETDFSNLTFIEQTGYGINWVNHQTGRHTLRNHRYQGSVLRVDGTYGLEIHDILFQDLADAARPAFHGEGARGSLSNVNFVDVAAHFVPSGTARLGVDAPTGWGANGNFIQALEGLGPDLRYGWRYDGAWYDLVLPLRRNPIEISTDKTITAADAGRRQVCTAELTLTLPAPSALPGPIWISVREDVVGVVTVVPPVDVSIDVLGNGVEMELNPGDSITLDPNGSARYEIGG